MELRHLQYFVAVAEEENVTRAAARLYISQPPLTRQIHDLEEELGVELFHRKGRSLSLTRAGRLFLTEAREILEKVDAAVARLRAETRGRSSTLEVGYAPSPTAGVLPELLRSFRNAHPDIQINLHDCSSPEMLEGLNNRTLDAAFMVKQRPQLLRGLTCHVIATFPIGVAIPQSHKWARRKKVSVKEVLAEPLVTYGRKQFPDYHELLKRVLGSKPGSMQIAAECDSGPSLLTAIESGKGIAVTAAWSVDAAGSRLRFIPIAPAPPPAEICITLREEPMAPAVEALWSEARKNFTEPGPA